MVPAFWLVVGLLGVGAWRIASILRRAFVAYPVATTAAVVLFALYAVPFVLLMRGVDYLQRGPPLLFAISIAWGGLVATSAAIAGDAAVQDLLAKLVSPRFAAGWGSAISGAGVEEVLKLLGVVALVLMARRRFTSVADGFVYGAFVGLGFQVVENIVFAVNAVAVAGGSDRIGPVVATFFLRGFLGGLWSHALFTAIAGAGVAYAFVRRNRPLPMRLLGAVGCLVAAAGVHLLWNSPILVDGFGYGLAGILAALLLKAIPALLIFIALVRAAERREADYFAAVLAGLGDPRMATPSEISALMSPVRRAAARRLARSRLGTAGARAVRRLQRAQAQLAVALARDPGADVLSPDVLRRRREVLLRRHELLALGVAATRAPARHYLTLDRSAVIIAMAAVIGLVAVGMSIAIRAIGGM
jgi:RsiW-degrading membrane proteinase PrsW (M82 family)